MTSFDSKKTVYISLFVVLLIVIGASVILVSAETSEPQTKQRALVVFNHDSHTEYASDCMDCHHKYQDDDTSNNILDESELEDNYPDGDVVLNALHEGDLSEVKCASCHNYKAKTVSQDAFHRQCIGCHENDGGPLMCGECHLNSNTLSDGE